VRCGPLRESSHRVLGRVHIADGNYGEAIRQHEHYRRSLGDHVGLTPSPHIRDLIAPLSAADVRSVCCPTQRNHNSRRRLRRAA
jgi:hypothetical protein